jgi:hypothetical protein
MNICVAQETVSDKAGSLEKLTALEYVHGTTPQQNATMADLNVNVNGINVSDSYGTKREKSFKMDSLRLTMKVLDPDLWRKYKCGHFECSMGVTFTFTGSLSVISGLIINLTTNSKKQTAEEIDNQKRIGKHLMISGGAMAAIGIPLFAIGLHKQQVAIRECEKRIQERKAELQFGITSSGGFGLALKF